MKLVRRKSLSSPWSSGRNTPRERYEKKRIPCFSFLGYRTKEFTFFLTGGPSIPEPARPAHVRFYYAHAQRGYCTHFQRLHKVQAA